MDKMHLINKVHLMIYRAKTLVANTTSLTLSEKTNTVTPP